LLELKSLALFWENIARQNEDLFSEDIRKKLFVLNYAPNGMWQYITSVYFLRYKNDEDTLDEIPFGAFLDKITAFIYTYAVTNPGVNALRTPVFEEMINIINGVEVSFANRKFNAAQARSFMENYKFTNGRPVTRSLITWYAFTFDNQQLLDINESFQLEHIFAKKRYEMEGGLENEASLESLGNKVLLEDSINIRASDFTFDAKQKIYSGEVRRGKNRDRSKIAEIEELIKRDGFVEQDIVSRNKDIIDKFFTLLEKEDLIVR
jgi:hypothetical protein